MFLEEGPRDLEEKKTPQKVKRSIKEDAGAQGNRETEK